MRSIVQSMYLFATVGWLVMLSASVRGEMISAGTSEIGISGILDVDTIDGTLFEVDGTWGRFIRDYWEAGVILGSANSDSLNRFRGGVFTEYFFDFGRVVLPYVGFSLNVFAASVDFDYEDSPSGSEIAYGTGLSTGLMGFLTREVALSFGLELNWASQDIFLSDNDVEDSDIRFKLGLRYFF